MTEFPIFGCTNPLIVLENNTNTHTKHGVFCLHGFNK